MTERDPFERELARALAPRPVPANLQRRTARIPLDHPRGTRPALFWRRWLGAVSAPWTAGMAAALVSLAVGFWLGFSGLAEDGAGSAVGEEELVSLVFPSVPTSMGDYQ